MNTLLAQSGYRSISSTRVWAKPDYSEIAYSDGDEVEQRIAAIVGQSTDISILSTELREQITDWPSLYHLSSTRANILRPFRDILEGADVLEIGAGCGAITRYLGECGAHVLALEGTLRRAAIARSRTRDLSNVEVVADKFDQFKLDGKFDVITLIGVLEYANLFTPGEHPAISMLRRARAMLKPSGKMIIAIENQLGLKYFAGAPEDHLGQPMYGIEGRYRSGQPQTYGRKVLADMLTQVGFESTEFMAPFPDYKLPVSIVTESGFACEEFDAGALALQSARRDPQLPPYLSFSPELAWPVAAQNGIAFDLANSFLLVAGHYRQARTDSSILAYHYSTERSRLYCKETRFELKGSGSIELQYRLLSLDSKKARDSRLIKFSIPQKADYAPGRPLSMELIEIVTRDGWLIDEVGAFLRRHLTIVVSIASSGNAPLAVDSVDTHLPGACFDLLPQNIIIGSDGRYIEIDREWVLTESFPAGYLVFRTLLLLVQTVTRFGCTASVFPLTRMGFFSAAFKSAGLDAGEGEIRDYGNREATVQAEVSGCPVDKFLNWWSDSPLPLHSLSMAVTERDGQIINLNQALAERDGHIIILNRVVSERDLLIATLNEEIVRRGEWALALDRQLQDANATIAGILSSTSWRMTAPLRAAKSLLGFTPNDDQHKIRFPLRFIRMLYHLAPLGDNKKERLQDIFYARFPGVFKSLKSYEAWVKRRNYRGGILSPPKDSRVIPRAWVAETIIAPDDIRLSSSDKPLVSIIIPAYGQVKFTLQCLNSIAKNPPQIPFEVIVIDDSSPDNSREMLGKVSGIRLILNEKNSGFILSCNKGASEARGEYLCFLNNDTVVSPGWLEELVRTFEEFPGTGLVGSKLVYPDGTLQEAGGIIWRDGSAWNFGRGQDPSFPMFNYAREVDYCSGASIMVPKRLFDELGGFDELYAPAYCEDCDLALKVRAHGLSVIYQPHSVVTHFEGITSGTDVKSGTKAYQINNTIKLFDRWREHLANHQRPGQDVDNAKDRLATRRVLVLDHCTPTPDQDAGSIMAFNIMLLLRQTGFQVTFIPEDNFLYMPRYTTDLQRAGIEALYAPYFTSLNQHLVESGNRYDLVLIFRPSVMDNHIKNIRKLCPRAKVLFHTVDLHYVRMQREAALNKDQKAVEAAERMKSLELRMIQQADATIVVSTTEKEVLDHQLPQSNVFIFPLILDIPGTDKTFQERRDIVFVGGYQHLPNVDAVKYFVNDVMPILRRRLPGVQFYAVGSNPPVEIRALAAKDVVITGFEQDLNSLLGKMRVSVAPLRYGAGIKGKIGTAMACGLPSVATSLAVEGMSLTQGINILVADTAYEIANSIVRLYEDDELWNNISSKGIKFAEKTWGAEAAWNVLNMILKDLGIVSTRKRRSLILHH